MKQIKYPSIKGKYRKRVFDYKKMTKQKEISKEDRQLLKKYTPKQLLDRINRQNKLLEIYLKLNLEPIKKEKNIHEWDVDLMNEIDNIIIEHYMEMGIMEEKKND